MEIEARKRAKIQVANLLQRPDQLEKVEQIRRRVARRKGSVEAMLKSAIQSQLDGVKTGLTQLSTALKDIQEIKQNLDEVDETYNTIAGLGDKLKGIREENSRHSQLAAAMDNLTHIFNVPEMIVKCTDLISEGKLLHAHKFLSELETSRDELLYELHRQASQSPTDRNMVMQYFSGLENLSKSLSKQLFLILERTIMSVRMEPTIIVTVLRIIEREERLDTLTAKRYEQMNLPDRPKRWRDKAFEVMESSVFHRIEGTQMGDRTTDKMWLVRHLEVTRQLVLEDLRVVKTLCEQCFPPHYDIVNRYTKMFHDGISQHLNEVVSQGLEGNEIVSLLTWIRDYTSKDLMGHPDINIDVSKFAPLLEPQKVKELQNQYVQNLRNNFREWMSNSLKTDSKDWMKDVAPEADDKGYYNTTLPVLLIQMIEQNLEVAATIDLVPNVISMCCEELKEFSQTYTRELSTYREQHLINRNVPQHFLLFLIGNVNNCLTFHDFASTDLKNRAKEQNISEDKFKVVAFAFNNLASGLCEYLLEEVFMDLEPHMQELLTKKWVASKNAVDTICVTIEDYCQDFVHLKDLYYDFLLEKAERRIAKEYYKALFARKIMFKSYEERCPVAEKIIYEGEQLSQHFKKLIRKKKDASLFDAMPPLAEIIKLRDTSMMSLEITDFVTKYPDVKIDQLVSLLMMRGDVGRGDARQLVVDCLGEDHDLKARDKQTKTIFSQLGP